MKHLPDERLNKGLLAIAYVLLTFATAISCFLLFSKDIDYPIGIIIVDLLSVILALVYFISGYKKDSAKYFRIVMLFKAFTYIIDYLYLALDPVDIPINAGTFISLAITLIMYGNTLLVAVSKDLGKRISFILYGSNICLYIINLLVSIDTGLSSQLSSIVWLLLSIVGLIMIEAKYIDKSNRSSY